MRTPLIAIALMAAPTAAFAQATPAPAAPAAAQTGTPAPAAQAGVPAAPAQVTQGAAVFDLTGASIGTVTQINGTTAVVDTGTNKVGVPVGNFAAGPKGLVLSNTKADLDAAAGQAAAQSAAQLKSLMTAGTDVHGINGQVLGKIKTADGELVTVTSAKGGDVRLPASGFAATPAGLTVGISQADFDKAVAASKK